MIRDLYNSSPKTSFVLWLNCYELLKQTLLLSFSPNCMLLNESLYKKLYFLIFTIWRGIIQAFEFPGLKLVLFRLIWQQKTKLPKSQRFLWKPVEDIIGKDKKKLNWSENRNKTGWTGFRIIRYHTKLGSCYGSWHLNPALKFATPGKAYYWV